MKSKILHLNLRELLEDFSSILSSFIVGTILLIISAVLYYKNKISFLIFRAFLFLYLLTLSIILLRLYYIQIIKHLAITLKFKLITPFYLQPRIEGYYKKKWFQIHYRSKETGKDPGILRTYVKLQYKKPKKFDKKKFSKYRDYQYKDHKIIVIKHLIRPYKNYLLLKRNGFVFDKKKIIELMDFLIKVAKETEK